jgi:hypothetical protein
MMQERGWHSVAITAEQFLHALFAPNDKVCLRTYSDRDDDNVKGKMIRFPLLRYAKFHDELVRRNTEEFCGVHAVINYGGHYDQDIKRINAVFFEIDDGSFDEQFRRVSQSPLEPSMIVKTKRSLHTYFLVKGLPVEKFRNVQERLSILFSSDAQIKNESRNMRLPGFNHVKGDPVPVICLKFDPNIVYTPQEIYAVLPPLPKKVQKLYDDVEFLFEKGDLAEIIRFVKSKLQVKRDRKDKINCRCLFPEKHKSADRSASAVFYKKSPGYFCSGCGTYMSVRALATHFGWTELVQLLDKYAASK